MDIAQFSLADSTLSASNPHAGQPIYRAFLSTTDASGAMILVHGRGASAQSILPLAEELFHPELAYLAPQAANSTWYPQSFLTPLAQNEPFLSGALDLLMTLFDQLLVQGLSANKIIVAGFSQGACLASEFVARGAERYGRFGGLLAFSGGLIGPDGTPRDYAGTLEGTPVFLGCSDVDFHIPKERVLETERVLAKMGATVITKLYPNMGHTINADEINHAQKIVAAL